MANDYRLGLAESVSRKFWSVMFREMLGTMLHVLIGGAAMSRHSSDHILTSSLAWGGSYIVMLYSFGSHGYLNPAIASSLFLTKRIPLVRALGYIVAQLLGSVGAVAVLGYIVNPAWYSDYGPGAVLVTDVMSTNLWQVCVWEGVSTLILSLIITLCKDEELVGNDVQCLAVGACITTLHLVLLPITMCGLNPARAIAPHLIALQFPSYHWVYWVGPVVGAFLGRLCGIVFRQIVEHEEEKEVKFEMKPLLK